MSKLFASPYDQSAIGFYFESAEEFEEKAEALRNSHGQKVEEFEIDFIDGDDADLFKACEINQSNLSLWFDDIETMDEYKKPALFYLMDNNICMSVEDAMDKIDDVSISESSLEDAAAELFDECYLHDVPEHVRAYIDYEKFARDCQLGGDMCEFEFAGTTYTCTNSNSI